MTEEQLENAQLLRKKIKDITADIEIWKNIDYKDTWMPLKDVSRQLFEDFRATCISEIRKKKIELEKEFAEI